MTPRAAILSIAVWAGAAVYLFLRWNGLTLAHCFASLWLLVPYGLILVLLTVRANPTRVWVVLIVSFIVGGAGTFEYFRRTIVNLSGSSARVFAYVPILQLLGVCAVMITLALLKHFWQSRSNTADRDQNQHASEDVDGFHG